MSRDETSESNTELADALRAVAKQLQEMSELLLPAVASIAEAAKRKKENDESDSGVKAEATEKELWETTRDTIKEDDQVQIDSWKDELNNLLVFAGLFSAVVTAFTVESYTWLQQDPGDTTNMFISYISLQMSSFTNTPPFINSSAPALPLQNVTSAFTPATIAVPVNTLWVLSLTLSLMSAFFAIAVQQWLRQYRLPANIPVRRAVELSVLRIEGLITWQVPGIISLLPLLLQIAVVLFLIGLFILLRSLNTAVTTAFGAMALLGLIAFLVSACIPLISFQCPYKSPLVPTVLIVLQWLSYPFALIAAVFVLPFHAALNSERVTNFLFKRSYHRVGRFLIRFRRRCNWLVAYVSSFGRHMFVDMGQFWLRREYQHLLTLDDNACSELRQRLVAGVLLVCSHSSFMRLMSCMGCFSLNEWRGVYRAIIMSSLRIFLPDLHFRDIVDGYGNTTPRAASFVRKWLSSRHSDLLLKAQEVRNWRQDGRLSWEDHHSLVLSSEVEKYGAQGRTQYAKHLFHICDNQTIDEDVCLLREPVTPFLMIKAFNTGYAPEVDEARIVVNFATKHGTRGAVRHYPQSDEAHRMLFASCTAALVAMTHHPFILREECGQLLSTFFDILRDDGWKRMHKEKLKAFYAGRPEHVVRAFQPIPGIHRTLCRTLVELAKKNVLLQDTECPSIRLASTLREIYDGINEADVNEACKSLDRFSRRIPYNGDLGRWKQERQATRLQEQPDAVLLGEGDATPAHASPPRAPLDGDHPSEHDELCPREVEGSQNFPSPNNANARREITAENHGDITAASVHTSIAEEIGTSTEAHADHTSVLASMMSGGRGIQCERDTADAVAQPVATDDPLDPQETSRVASSSMSNEEESEVDDCPHLTQPAHVTASSLSQPLCDSKTLKFPHSALTASLPDDPSALSANLTPNVTSPPDTPASSPSDATDNIDAGVQNADLHGANLLLGAPASPPSDTQPANLGSADSAVRAIPTCDASSTAQEPQHYDSLRRSAPSEDGDESVAVGQGGVAVTADASSPAANMPVAAYPPAHKEDMPAAGESSRPALSNNRLN